MKWISSISISLPLVYAIAWDIELSEVDQSFLILVFLQTIASMYHRYIDSEFTLKIDQTMICAIWLFLTFPVYWFYCILFSALFCRYYTYVIVFFSTFFYIANSELKVLQLLTGLSGVYWFFYNYRNDVQWTRWIWHVHVGLILFYPIYLHDYGCFR